MLLLVQVRHQGQNFWGSVAVDLTTPCWALSTGINIIVTVMIIGRLVYWRRMVRLAVAARADVHRPAWGPDAGMDIYTSVAAMLVESAALNIFFGALVIGTYMPDSDAMNIFLPIDGQVLAISPLLIIIRVADGRAVTRQTVADISAILFSEVGPSRGAITTSKSAGAITRLAAGRTQSVSVVNLNGGTRSSTVRTQREGRNTLSRP